MYNKNAPGALQQNAYVSRRHNTMYEHVTAAYGKYIKSRMQLQAYYVQKQ